jgi:hypothetical protein
VTKVYDEISKADSNVCFLIGKVKVKSKSKAIPVTGREGP